MQKHIPHSTRLTATITNTKASLFPILESSFVSRIIIISFRNIIHIFGKEKACIRINQAAPCHAIHTPGNMESSDIIFVNCGQKNIAQV